MVWIGLFGRLGGIRLCLLLLAHNVAAQSLQAFSSDGKALYTVSRSDSLRILSPAVVATKDSGTWHFRRSLTGEVLGAPIQGSIEPCSFGLKAPLAVGGWLVLPAKAYYKLHIAKQVKDAGQGWAVLADSEQPLKLVFEDGGMALDAPLGADSICALTSRHLVYYSKKKAGLLTLRGLEGHVALPAVYDSITGPRHGYVLAYGGGKAQIYLDNGQPVYAGAFDEAAFLNADWMAGKTNSGWQAVHLRTLKHTPCQGKPVALGDRACLLKKKEGLCLYDSSGKEQGKGLQDALAQDMTNRLLARRGSKWYMLSPPASPSIHLKTPTVRRLDEFSEGLAALCSEAGLWGFVDAHGFMRISPRYEACLPFMAGLAAVRIAGKWGLIDKTERLVCQPRYDTAFAAPGLGLWFCRSSESAALYGRAGKVGVYADARPASKSVLIRQPTGWGAIKPNGTSLIPAWYADLKPAGAGRYIARRGTDWAVLSDRHEAILNWSPKPIIFDDIDSIFFVQTKEAKL